MHSILPPASFGEHVTAWHARDEQTEYSTAVTADEVAMWEQEERDRERESLKGVQNAKEDTV